MADIGKPNDVVKNVPATKTTEVSRLIVIDTPEFIVTTPELIAQAEKIYREQVAETLGESAKVTDLRVTKVDHHVGKCGRYTVVGDVTV